jgi:hypothetical protein
MDRSVVELQPKKSIVTGSIREATRCFPMHLAAPARQQKINQCSGKAGPRALPAPHRTAIDIDEPLTALA